MQAYVSGFSERGKLTRKEVMVLENSSSFCVRDSRPCALQLLVAAAPFAPGCCSSWLLHCSSWLLHELAMHLRAQRSQGSLLRDFF